MSNPMLDSLRADMEARHKHVRFITRLGHASNACFVGMASWSAAMIARGDQSEILIGMVLFNGASAVVGIRMVARNWASWLELRAKFEREIERLESKCPE